MKKSLTHLPAEKRAELKAIAAAIREERDDVEMIILFGSFARGDWRDEAYTENNVYYRYVSDYDILVIVRDGKNANNPRRWHTFEIKLNESDLTPITLSLMGHDINFVNNKLSDGDDFYCDVKKEGVALYDSKAFKLARPRRLKPEERQKFAKTDYKEWYTSAGEFFDNYVFNFEKRRYKIAAFELHQAVERLFTTTIKVFTRTRPRVHDIEALGKKAASLDARLLGVFPRATKEQQKCYDLLKRAYIDARYFPDYKITGKQLAWLADHVRKLRTLTRQVCKDKIESFNPKK